MKYVLLREELLDLVDGLEPGAPLPAERALAGRLGVSRMTLRRAIDDLVSTGRVIRRHGAGTFVGPGKVSQGLAASSFSADMQARGMTPGSRTLSSGVIPAGAALGHRLEVSPDEEVLRVQRLRLANGSPMAIELLHVPARLVPCLQGEDLAGQSFYATLRERFGLAVSSGWQSLEATVIDPEESAVLEVPLHSPAFLFERTSRDQYGRVVEFVRSVYRGDRYPHRRRNRHRAQSRRDGWRRDGGGRAEAMIVIGLSSGTSVDGIDVAAGDFDIDGDVVWMRPLGHREVAYSTGLRRAVLQLLPPNATSVEEVCRVDTGIGREFAAAAVAAVAELTGGLAELIASHGQTVFHWVDGGRARGTLQLGQPAWIAEATGLPVVSDLRVNDVAAGGQGAPLASLLDVLLLGEPTAQAAAALNLGGIANVTVVRPGSAPIAFDTGPANALLDAAMRRISDGRAHVDRDGAQAARGTVDPALLRALRDHPLLPAGAAEVDRQGDLSPRLPHRDPRRRRLRRPAGRGRPARDARRPHRLYGRRRPRPLPRRRGVRLRRRHPPSPPDAPAGRAAGPGAAGHDRRARRGRLGQGGTSVRADRLPRLARPARQRARLHGGDARRRGRSYHPGCRTAATATPGHDDPSHAAHRRNDRHLSSEDRMQALDLIVIVVYLAGSAWLGLKLSGTQHNVKDHFLGNRQLPWWAVCLSVVANTAIFGHRDHFARYPARWGLPYRHFSGKVPI